MTDQALIDRVLTGETDLFKELIGRYESRVAATVIGMLGPGPEAEDVGQETFIRLFHSLDKFRGESNLGTYVTRIAINLSLNALKRRKRKRELYVVNSEDGLSNLQAENQTMYNEEKVIIEKALQKLEPKFRSVVVLRLIEGYSTKETADILKLPQGTVLSRLARAQQKLKEHLHGYYREGYE